jgi:predicted negative regulator of RcsB-dependent stress response
MDNNKPQSQESPVAPGVAEQLEQIKKAVPDTSQRLFDFLVGNLKPIAIGCGAVVLAAAVFAGVNSWRARTAAKAADALGVILIEKTEPAARIQALDDFLKTAPSKLRPTALLELASTAMLTKQFDKAATAWDELEKDGGPDMKIIAAIGRAKCLLMTDKAKDALALLESVKTKAPESYALPLTRQIAAAAEQAGNTQVALTAYSELAEKDTGPGKPFYEFKVNQLKSKS